LIVPNTASSNEHYIRTVNQAALATGAVGTFSVFVKAAGYTSLSIRLVGTDAAIINYDLTAVTADDAGGTIEFVGNSWYRCTITGTGTGTNAWPWIYPNQQATYAGDGTSGIYIYGAHLYRSDLGGMNPVPGAATGFETYVPTNGNAEYLPRVGHHVFNGSTWVNEGLLIESEVRTNLVYPSQFPTSAVGLWAAPNLATAVVDQTGPDGLTSATTLTASSTGNSLRCRITTTQSGSTTYTLSFYAKAGSSAYIYARNIAVSGSPAVDGVWWDVSDFSVAVQGSGVAVAGSQPVGNDWYRCYMTATTASSPANNLVDIGIADTAGVVSTTSGDTGIFYGAQLDQGQVVNGTPVDAPTPSSYIPTYGSTVTRGGQSLTVPANWYDADNPTYTGPELVTAGSHTLMEPGWSYANGVYSYSASTVDLLKFGEIGISAGRIYSVSLDIANRTTGNVGVKLFGGGLNSLSSNGTHTIFLTGTTADGLQISGHNNFDGDVSNISVRQVSAPQFGWPEPEYIGPELVVDGSGNWVGDFDVAADLTEWGHQNTSGTSIFSVTGGEATFTRSTFGDSFFKTDVAPPVAGVYLLTFDITAISGGSLRYSFSPNSAANPANQKTASSVGSYATAFVSDGTLLDFVFDLNTNGASVTIDNISVREINPLSVSIQMDGRMTYGDEDEAASGLFFGWSSTYSGTFPSSQEYITAFPDTDRGTGGVSFRQRVNATYTTESGGSAYTPGINVPFNIASRHGSNFIRGATDGVLTNLDTTPTALPDLSNTDLEIAQDFMGTIGTFRQFAGDIGDTGLVTATNPSTEPTLSLTFDGTGGSFYNLSWSE